MWSTTSVSCLTMEEASTRVVRSRQRPRAPGGFFVHSVSLSVKPIWLGAFIAWVLFIGGSAQAAYHLTYEVGHAPTKGIPALLDVSGLATAPTPVLPAVKATGTSKPATVRITNPSTSIWDRIAACESGGNWSHSGGTYEGGLQFLPSTWRAAGGTRYAPHAYQASREQQIEIASHWLAQTSWRQWPVCSRKAGVR